MIRVGIFGYGNLGKGVECAIAKNPDMELVGVFTRRDPETIKTECGIPVVHVDHVAEWKNKIDVMIPATIDDILTFADEYDAPEQVEAVFKWDVSDIFYNYFIYFQFILNWYKHVVIYF